MACPNLEMTWQIEELSPRPKKVARTTTREVAACGADVSVEDRVTAEDILWGNC